MVCFTFKRERKARATAGLAHDAAHRPNTGQRRAEDPAALLSLGGRRCPSPSPVSGERNPRGHSTLGPTAALDGTHLSLLGPWPPSPIPLPRAVVRQGACPECSRGTQQLTGEAQRGGGEEKRLCQHTPLPRHCRGSRCHPASGSRPHQEPISSEAQEGSFAFLGSSSACNGSGDSWWGCSDNGKDGNPSHSLLQQPPGPKCPVPQEDLPLPLRALVTDSVL